jgi:integrase
LWLAHRPDLRPSTTELYAILWRRWLEPAFDGTPLGAMTREAWRAWWVKQTTTHPGSTQPRKAYALARTILNTAVADGVLRANPCQVKGAARDTARERPVASPEQITAIAAHIDEQYRPMVYLAAYCSLRFGELAGQRRRRVNLLHRTITVEEQAVELGRGQVVFGLPKTDAGRRTVAVPRELIPYSRTTSPPTSTHIQTPWCSRARAASRYGGPSSGTDGRRRAAQRGCRTCTSTTCAAAARRGQRRPAPPSPN